jgi:sugar lactone lactonase YvrE
MDLSDYGAASDMEQDGAWYCVDPASGDIRVVADDFVKPNGWLFAR